MNWLASPFGHGMAAVVFGKVVLKVPSAKQWHNQNGSSQIPLASHWRAIDPYGSPLGQEIVLIVVAFVTFQRPSLGQAMGPHVPFTESHVPLYKQTRVRTSPDGQV